MTNRQSPVALFVYKRPVHTQQTLNALKRNKGIEHTELYVFSDNAKTENDKKGVDEVREIIRKINGFKKVHIIENQENKGLAKSITEGVTQIVNTYGNVIVLEDDLVTSSFFLTYMNTALEIYNEDEIVMHVAAHIPPVRKKLPDTFFYNQATCWGWGTWKRAWQMFSDDADSLKNKILETGDLDKFNIDNAHDFMKQLQENIDKKIQTWAVKWQAAVFLNKGLCLHPGKTLVKNIGLDWSGEHTGPMPQYFQRHIASKLNIKKQELKECEKAKKLIVNYLKNHNAIYSKQNENIIKRWIKTFC